MPELGRAVLFIYTADGKNFADAFDEVEDEPEYDPVLRAERLQASVEDDFPGAIFSIGMNQRARDLMANRNMRNIGFTDYDHAKVQRGE